MRQHQPPTKVNEVQSFLGSLNYYHRFFEGYPVITSTLYELTEEWIQSGKDLGPSRMSV